MLLAASLPDLVLDTFEQADRGIGSFLILRLPRRSQARQKAVTDLVHAIREYRKLGDQPLTLRGSEYAHAVQELNKAIDRAEELLQ